ncbi:lauroyl acyltransferase [Fibrobacter sp. UWB16]|uniref:lauroyl acyltransferase n=1 Tax=Fibrobacter sp. UWB16 TaxID=1945874 RepID=UPI001F27710E|nr:lauroyl acyltransferase [Fibrobacter sp. UWB16]
MPNIFYSAFFAVVFPIYKVLHKKRAYGRVEKHLAAAKEYVIRKSDDTNKMPRNMKSPNPDALATINARDTFKGIFWNALESYRGLAHIKSVEKRIVYENEHIIQGAIAECAKQNAPIAGISIHQGAFELLHRALCRYSEHVHLITDSVGDIAFREVLKDLRSDPHLTEYHPDETGCLIRELFRTKGILAMVIDQGKHTKGNTVSLFGRPSTLYLRLPQKINEMGAGIVTFRTWSEKKRIVIRFEKYYPPKYDVTHKPPHINQNTISAPTCGTHAGSSDERANATIDNSPLVTGIAREVETWIAEHPEQWSWNYHGNFIATL